MIFGLWQIQRNTQYVKTENGLPTHYFYDWLNKLYSLLKGTLGLGIGAATPVTVTLAKLTTGGTNGSLTVVNGVITAYVAPT